MPSENEGSHENGDRSENADYQYGKRRLSEIDRRARFLVRRIEDAIVVEPSRQSDRDRVFFGATVAYVGAFEGERTVTIVGVDEADMRVGKISLTAPIATALIKARSPLWRRSGCAHTEGRGNYRSVVCQLPKPGGSI